MHFPTQDQLDELSALRTNAQFLITRLAQSEAENRRLREDNKALAAAKPIIISTTPTTGHGAAPAAPITTATASAGNKPGLTQIYTPEELAAKLQEAEKEIERLRQPGAEAYAPAPPRKKKQKKKAKASKQAETVVEVE